MLEKVKQALHIKNSMNDDDIQRTIDACLADLRRVGIDEKSNREDPIIFSLVVEYARANYNIDGEAEQFRKNYERRRDAVSQCAEYMGKDE